jgi:hypothetical protein
MFRPYALQALTAPEASAAAAKPSHISLRRFMIDCPPQLASFAFVAP